MKNLMNSNKQSYSTIKKYFNPRGALYTIPKPTTISDGVEQWHKHGEFVFMKGKGYISRLSSYSFL